MSKNYSIATIERDTNQGKIADTIPQLRVTATLRNPTIEEKTREEIILVALLEYGYSKDDIADALGLVNVNFSLEETDGLGVGLFVNKTYVEFMMRYQDVRPQEQEKGLRIIANYIADNHMVAKKGHGDMSAEELLALHAARKQARIAEMMKK